MNDAHEAGQDDHLDLQFHREMVSLGWRLPQAEAEVELAEEAVAEYLGELPERLRDDAEIAEPGSRASTQASLLDRYLRDGGADGGPKREGPRQEPPRGRDLDRS